MSSSLIGLRRLFHQRITHPNFAHVGEVAAWFGAMQGQDYLGTKWAFGLRLPGSTDADIEQAIIERKVIRAWVLRGTLHYVAPNDIHWMLDLLAPRQISGSARRYKELELDDATLTRSTNLIAALFHDDTTQLTRDEIFAHLNEQGISTAGQRGVHMLSRAALEKLIVQGELRRNVTTFLALAPGKTLPKDEALAELARRYFTSHAPATLADFATWSGLPMGEARAGLADAKSALVEATVDGQAYWLPPEAAKAPQSSLYLLPGFDEFVLGYKDRSAVLDPQFNNNICPGGNGMFSPTIVLDGRIVGTWKRTPKKKTVEITPDVFPPCANAFDPALFATAAERYAAFLNLQPVIKPTS